MKKIITLLSIFIFTMAANAQWTQVSTGLTNSMIMAIAVNGTHVYAGTYGGGVHLSTNDGDSWTPVNNGLPYQDVLSLAVRGTNVFVGLHDQTSSGGGCHVTSNNGVSWSLFNSGMNDNQVRSIAVNDTAVYVISGSVLGGGGVLMSSDNHPTWQTMNNGLPNIEMNSITLKGSNAFLSTLYGGIYASSTSGALWATANNGIPSNVNFFYVFSVMGSDVYAGSDNGVWKTTDDGASWTQVNNGITAAGMNIRSFANTGSILFAGTYGGVFMSVDNGNSWTELNNGLGDLETHSLAISDNYLYVGTHSSGVWRFPLNEIAGLAQEKVSSSFSIYPNPVSDLVTLSFDNQNISNLDIRIYNLMGDLVHSEELSNSNESQINIQELSDGIYTLSIDSNGLIENKKLIIKRN